LLIEQMTNPNDHLQFAHRGADVTIWPMAKIISSETISLGDSVIIDDFVLVMGGRKMAIGCFIHIASFTSITGGGEFVMEDFATLSSGIRVLTGTDDFLGNYMANSTVPYPYRQPERTFVHMKKHSGVGANSVILPGVTIGEGAAIGANSLVLEDCEPWTIYVGSPARPLKRRRRERVLELEAQLCHELYDAQGRYIPKSKRTPTVASV
jgi:acetyltransferase-like isoleucine patch superfamily enzyme